MGELGSGEDTKDYIEKEPIKIVVRYADGRVLKGYTQSFFPNKPVFRFFPISDQPTQQAIDVHLKDLKALFFVRDFQGNASYDECKHFSEQRQPVGRKVELTFKDGEVLVGTTVGYDPHRPGFFLHPADPKSNNLRVFVVLAAVKKVRPL